MKQLILTVTAVALVGIAGCSKSAPNASLKSVDPNKTEAPKAVGGTKDKGNATSAPPVIQ